MKKTMFTVASVAFLGLMLLTGCSKMTGSNKVEAFPTKEEKNTVKVSDYNQFQDFFTPAFQLVWNDFTDKIVGKKVEFIGGNPKIADEFNKQRLTDKMLSEKDYYKTVAPQTVKTKKTIEKDLKKKFKDSIEFLGSSKMMVFTKFCTACSKRTSISRKFLTNFHLLRLLHRILRKLIMKCSAL